MCRYFRDEEVALPVVVYLPAELYAYFTYSSWLLVTSADIKVVRIPICVMEDMMTAGLGMALKVENSLLLCTGGNYFFFRGSFSDNPPSLPFCTQR